MFAGNRSTVAYSAFGIGALDIGALTTAFHALLASYPVLNTQIVPAGHGYALQHAPHQPALQVRTCTALPRAGFTIVDPHAVCAIDVAQRGNDFRLTLLTHHSIADAGAALNYLEVLCSLYTHVVETGSAGTIRSHPLAISLERFLAERGYVIPEPCAPPAPRAETTVDSTVVVRHGRTRLGREQTTRLFDAARAVGLTVHGIVCAAILLAAHALSRSQGQITFGITSSVDLRTRTGAPIAAAQGTVIQGADTAILAVAPDDDPLRLARAVLDSLAGGLADHSVHQAFLRYPQPQQSIENPLMVTNWGQIPPLRLPEGLRVHDFRATVRGWRIGLRATTLPPSFFITTCDGRLSLDHPVWVIDESDPTVVWTAALGRAFGRILR
ncbi:phthiocerol/phthiodiolone dimycocerosyl transferase family protein [Mycobacteroides salmoniphilum]|uniref:Phthiocerol/phthiodiolone dimycocerosyl transferase n=1 Tax=Mycobacteroides salmoniphilum TaxID=404941 RepID=A0A4V3I1A3_9MYCO|nr:acyltransferase [Mycobacteroides salmoniphilum]TEA06781.1 Phthiocerol/phthiodiolone dimycocerosyl transferase [Mycobacteroides salmoniphilum]